MSLIDEIKGICEKSKILHAKESLVKEELRVWQVCEMPKKKEDTGIMVDSEFYKRIGYNQAIDDISQLKITLPRGEK